MSELESAASLFGSSNDSSNDPFASTGDDPFSSIGASSQENDTTDPFSSLGSASSEATSLPASQSPADMGTIYNHDHPSQTSENLFGTSSESDGLFDSIAEQQGGSQDFFSSTGISQENSAWSGADGGQEHYSATAPLDAGSGAAAGQGYEPVSSMQTPTYEQQWTGYSQAQDSYGYSGYGQNADYYSNGASCSLCHGISVS